jgi:assimilatory nitrate reductase catalytic subunit
MTRTGLSPLLASHLPEPFVEIHPNDADAAGLDDGGFAKISTAHGACVVKVVVSDSQRPGSLFVPIHWSGETASGACVGDLIAPHTDPHSGQPEAKATPAAITPASFPLHGLVRAPHPITLPKQAWWVRVAVPGGMEYRLATSAGPMVWHDFAYRELTGDGYLAEELEGDSYRAAAFTDGELDACLCIGPLGASLRWDPRALAATELKERTGFTLRRIDSDMAEVEPVICACFQIGTHAVREAIASGAVKTVAEIGRTLRAGTNCGSCLPELKSIIARERA